MEQPLVSILMTAYNREKYIAEAILGNRLQYMFFQHVILKFIYLNGIIYKSNCIKQMKNGWRLYLKIYI
jgi:hypothetical protein